MKKGGEVFQGTEKFRVGESMSGLCSAGGVCSFEYVLRPGLRREVSNELDVGPLRCSI